MRIGDVKLLEAADDGGIVIPTLRGGFFSRLLKAGSPKRHRLEDFLTEVLGEILSNLAGDTETFLWFSRSFFLYGADTQRVSRWESWVRSFRSLNVRTQCPIAIDPKTFKRPDIVLFGDATPIGIVECKVGAGFTSSEIRGPDG